MIQGVPHLRELYYRDFHLRGFLRPSQEIPLTRFLSVSPPLARSNELPFAQFHLHEVPY